VNLVDEEATSIRGHLDPSSSARRILTTLNRYFFGEGGFQALNAGRLEEHLPASTAPSDLHPNDAQAHNNRGIAKAQLGDMEGARADWQRALEIQPGMREAEENLRKLGGEGGQQP